MALKNRKSFNPYTVKALKFDYMWSCCFWGTIVFGVHIPVLYHLEMIQHIAHANAEVLDMTVYYASTSWLF